MAMMIHRRLFLGALGALPMARLARGETAHRLTILHMNDFHSRHEAVDGRITLQINGGSGASP